MTIEEEIPLKEFEQWLYSQGDLLDNLNDELALAVFSFNYNQKGAHYEFNKIFVPHFDENEFMLWKIKANLRALIMGKETRDRILHDFYYDLGYDDYPFLQGIGYYMFDFEEPEYSGRSLSDLSSELKSDAQELLNEIELQEKMNPDFQIKSFRKIESELITSTVVSKKKWWTVLYSKLMN